MSDLFRNEFISRCESEGIEPNTRRSSADWNNPIYSIEGEKRDSISKELESDHYLGYARSSVYSSIYTS